MNSLQKVVCRVGKKGWADRLRKISGAAFVGFLLMLTAGDGAQALAAWSYEDANKELSQGYQSATIDLDASQCAADQSFMDALRGKPEIEALPAIEEHCRNLYWQKASYLEGAHRENMGPLRGRIMGDRDLKPAQREELIRFLETQYDDKQTLANRRYSENIHFMKRVYANDEMTPEEKRRAIASNYEKQRVEYITFMNLQRDNFKTEIATLLSQA